MFLVFVITLLYTNEGHARTHTEMLVGRILLSKQICSHILRSHYKNVDLNKKQSKQLRALR
jgi:hypothetical protein